MKTLLIALIFLSLFSCQKKEVEPMRISLPLKTISLDPHHMEDIYSMMVNLQIYSSLFQYLPDGSIVSDIANGYKVSPNHLIYSISLADKTFSDGSKIKAQDVKKSLERIFKKGASISADLQSIKLINIIDEKNLEIILSKPNPILIKQLATPDTSILKLDDNYNIEPQIFSGKYKVKTLTKQDLILKLSSHDIYTSKNPAKEIQYFFNESDKSYELAIKNKVDLVSLSILEQEKVKKIKELKFNEAVSGITHEQFLVINPSKVNLEWRKFLFSKFDSKDFIKKLGFNNLEPAYGYVPTVIKGSIKSSLKTELNFNIDETKLTPLELVINLMNGKMEKKIAETLNEIWQHPKLKLKFNYLDIDPYLESVFSKKFEASIVPKGLDYPDAMANLNYFKSDIKDNFFLVFDKSIDEKIAICSESFDKDAECFLELQKEIFKRINVLPLFFGTDKTEFWSKNIKKIPGHPLGLQFLKLDQIEMNDE